MPKQLQNFHELRIQRTILVRDVARDLDVVARRQRRQQIVLLENEPDGRLAQLGALGVGHAQQIAAGDVDAARGRRRQPAQDVKQRRLAGARRPDDRDELARLNVQIHAAQRMHIHFADTIGLAQPANGDDRLAISHTREPRWRPAARL